jgi:molybdate transport system substrate-binding protein
MALALLSTLAVAAPLRELGPRFEAASGLKLDTELGPTKLLMERIAAGGAADAAILTQDKLGELIAAGTIAAESRVDLVRSFVGVAVKAGAQKPDIATPAAFRTALLDAKSIAYSRAGASGLFFLELLRRLGIEGEINAKATVIPAGFTAELAARGEVELAIQQVSELMAVAGVDIVGPLPRELEPGTVFTGGVFAASRQREPATRLLRFLASSEAAAVIRRYGLEPLG